MTVSYPEPSAELLGKIIMRIRKEERVLVLRRLIIFSTTLVLSFIASIPTYMMLASQLQSSGFLNFASLAFSDFSVIATYWKTFVMIILETLPITSVALFLAIILTFLQSIRLVSKDVRTIIKATI